MNTKGIDFWVALSFILFFVYLRLHEDDRVTEKPTIGANEVKEKTSINSILSDIIKKTVSPEGHGSTYIKPEKYKYSIQENSIKFADNVWWDFLKFTKNSAKNYENTGILSEFIGTKSLNVCDQSHDGSLSLTSTGPAALSSPESCDWLLSDNFLKQWRGNEEDYYCPRSPSGVKCYQSQSQYRFCSFDNSMINMKRMREVKERAAGGVKGGHGSGPNIVRRFERGFLSADCGEFGLSNLSYFSLYQPTIGTFVYSSYYVITSQMPFCILYYFILQFLQIDL
jgi:hypothetical protein